MARAKKICALRGCPRVTDGRYCTPHQAAHDKARGTKAERGYGQHFQATRREYSEQHQHRDLTCWRCGDPIPQGTMFHLGHKDDDRDVIMGPEHPLCNLEAAGRSSHRFD